MQVYEILVQERSLKGNSRDMTLVKSSVGIDEVHFLFDNPEWLGFPVTVTFAQGDDLVTTALDMLPIQGSDEWVAEATVRVPCEVVDMTGPIRVTLQGTDSQGRHIITAKGAPLSVEEAGDIVTGEPPSEAPTIDQWSQAYANAVAAANEAREVLANVEARMSELADELRGLVDEATSAIENVPIATDTTAGIVQVGDGLSVTVDGVLSSNGLTRTYQTIIANLQRLAAFGFVTEFGGDGMLVQGSLEVREDVLPIARYDQRGIAKPDGTSISVDAEGTLSCSVPLASSETAGAVKVDGTSIAIAEDGTISATGGGQGGYVLPKASTVQLGGVRTDGYSLAVDEDGVLSVAWQYADDMEF